jgi:hypothetical protein
MQKKNILRNFFFLQKYETKKKQIRNKEKKNNFSQNKTSLLLAERTRGEKTLAKK